MPGIYPLPANPTARDIIERSIVAHPSLFADALEAGAAEDYRYLHSRRFAPSVSEAILSHAQAGERAALLVQAENVDQLVSECGPMILALAIACKLQCLPRHMQSDAAIAWDAANA